MTLDSSVTAGLLVIGDEILSGRTKDKNIGTIADHLTAIGIALREVRVVADIEPSIIEAVNALRHRYTYVFTTGGIGPTHDDITADAIAKAFEVSIAVDPRAVAIMKPAYEKRGIELNAARLRMARIPAGADLVVNEVSVAPGFRIGNVIVMAGVPSIMESMLHSATAVLQTGAKVRVRVHRRFTCGRRDCRTVRGTSVAMASSRDGQLSRVQGWTIRDGPCASLHRPGRAVIRIPHFNRQAV